MKRKKILIISNCAASKSESNGRIHMTHFANRSDAYEIHNFYLRGNPDIGYVKYFSFSVKEVLISFLTFGIYKPKIIKKTNFSIHQVRYASSKSSKPIFHFLRNIVFGKCTSIRKIIINYIKKNQIDCIAIWGCNAPFLYKIAFLASQKSSIPLFTITSEDYPLKKYNYISRRFSPFFKPFQSSLHKWCLNVYQRSFVNIYTNTELKDLYEEETKTSKSEVVFFGSNLKKLPSNKDSATKIIFYGGNLYKSRVDSIIEVSKFIADHKDIIIKIYGHLSQNDLTRIKSCKNIYYNGVVSYEKLIGEMSKANLLLHVEGFSNDYIYDCKYAFSTKISDYIMSGKPVLFYGPKEISGINYCFKYLPQFTATNKDDLVKIYSLLCLKNNNLKLSNVFSCDRVSARIYKIIEQGLIKY